MPCRDDGTHTPVGDAEEAPLRGSPPTLPPQANHEESAAPAQTGASCRTPDCNSSEPSRTERQEKAEKLSWPRGDLGEVTAGAVWCLCPAQGQKEDAEESCQVPVELESSA